MGNNISRNNRMKYRSDKIRMNSSQITYDRNPLQVENELFISIDNNGTILSFKIEGDDDRPSFVYNGLVHRSESGDSFCFFSDQILLSLSSYLRIPPRDAIVQYVRERDLHLRILSRQLTSYWSISEGELMISGHASSDNPWAIVITHQKSWSTNIDE